MDPDFAWIGHYAPTVAASQKSYTDDEVTDALTQLAPIVARMCGLAAADSDQLGTRVNIPAWAQTIHDNIDNLPDEEDSETARDQEPIDVDLALFVFPGSDIADLAGQDEGRLIAIPAGLYGNTLAALTTAAQLLRSWEQPTLFEAAAAPSEDDTPTLSGSEIATLLRDIQAIRRHLCFARATTESTPANQWPVLTVAVPDSLAWQAAEVLTRFRYSQILNDLTSHKRISSLSRAVVVSTFISVVSMLSVTRLSADPQLTD